MRGIKREQPFEDWRVWTGGPAEFGKRPLSERFIVDETLPGPFGELSGFNVRGCIEENDHSAVASCLDQIANQRELCLGQVVYCVKDDSIVPPQPRDSAFCNSRCRHPAPILWLDQTFLPKPLLIVVQEG